MPTFRHYQPSDAESWLRCRALSFLHSAYFDDVCTARPTDAQIQWVAVEGEQVVGLIDVAIDGELATIDSVATHPDFRGLGIASTLLDRARAELPPAVTTLDAWTRDDVDTLAWYHARGFRESEHYLHVYKSWSDSAEDFSVPKGAWALISAHFHAPLELEQEMRRRFARVHVCRRCSMPIHPEA